MHHSGQALLLKGPQALLLAAGVLQQMNPSVQPMNLSAFDHNGAAAHLSLSRRPCMKLVQCALLRWLSTTYRYVADSL